MKTMEIIIKILIFSVYIQVGYSDVSEEENLNKSLTEMTQVVPFATTESFRSSRAYRREEDDEEDDEKDDHDDKDMKNDTTESKSVGKNDNWGGYYDFLINEGSYKFWAVFQIATAALLVYSAFAALYYAKVNPSTTDDYEDYFLRRKRRKRRSLPLFFPLDIQTFQRIMEALDTINQKHK
ncbi:hypothetical protein HCN44_009694 [Aphidius gifuensis]|uniref:Uncharacterized protein n=1 Tax=Aphidius gifuensis TaxID=684658 RepID=A0A834Y873_APHGI|nr:uncharacterized protein LOC122860469 [Aphidius gifuensis]KAF7998296.1 hypothetical protein HCN44_009694 [Aphidius gifuensis]